MLSFFAQEGNTVHHRQALRRPTPAGPGRPMAGLWVIHADDERTARALESCPSAVVVRGGAAVYVGNSKHSPAYGAQLVKAGELIPMFIT